MQHHNAAADRSRNDSPADSGGPSRFLTWAPATLAQFAHEANEQNKQLREDLQTAIAAYRDLVRQLKP